MVLQDMVILRKREIRYEIQAIMNHCKWTELENDVRVCFLEHQNRLHEVKHFMGKTGKT